MPAARPATLLLLALLSASASPWALAEPGEGGPVAEGEASIDRADEQVQAAVGAVLVATLGERFDDPALELRLEEALIEPAGPRDRVVQGRGLLRLSGSGADDWLAFAYRSRYDSLFGTAGYPEITLGGDGDGEGERFVPNDATLVGELEARMAADLEAQPGAGRVFLQLDDISSLMSGERFLRIEASGVADFGIGGSTDARVDALYDLQAGRWLSVQHALAPNIVAHDTGGTAAGY